MSRAAQPGRRWCCVAVVAAMLLCCGPFVAAAADGVVVGAHDGGVTPAGGGHGALPPPSVADVLSAELAQTNLLIELHQRRAAALAELRTAVMGGARLSPSALEAALEGGEPRRLEGGEPRRAAAAGTPRRRAAADDDMAAGLESVLAMQAAIRAPAEGVTAMEMMTLVPRALHPVRGSRGASGDSDVVFVIHVLVTGDGAGVVRFYDGENGAPLAVLRDALPPGAGVSGLAHDMTYDAPLIVGGTDGSAAIVSIKSWVNGRLNWGHWAPGEARDGGPAATAAAGGEPGDGDAFKPDAPAGHVLTATLRRRVSTSSYAPAASTPPPVAAVAVFVARRVRYAITGDVDGTVAVFETTNGTLLHVLSPSPAAAAEAPAKHSLRIGAFAHSGALIAYARGGSIGFLNLVRDEPSLPLLCRGGNARITGLAFDALVPSLLWAGTDAGDLLAYNTRARIEEQLFCRLTAKVPLIPGHAAFPAAVRGYVVATAGLDRVLIVNATASPPDVILEWQAPGGGGGGGSGPRVRPRRAPPLGFVRARRAAQAAGIVASSVSIQGRVPTNVVLAVHLPSTGSVRLYESLLVYTAPDDGLGWLRMPMVGLAISLVLAFGFWKRPVKTLLLPQAKELADVIRAFREADAEGKGSMDEDEKGARVGGDDAKAGGGARAGGKRPAPAAAPPKAGSGDTAQAVGKGSPAHKPGGGKQ